MKKFFKRLNQFLYLREYEQHINGKLHEKDHELKYVQDLLLSSKGRGYVLYSDGEIDVYINHIEQSREEERKRNQTLLDNFNELSEYSYRKS